MDVTEIKSLYQVKHSQILIYTSHKADRRLVTLINCGFVSCICKAFIAVIECRKTCQMNPSVQVVRFIRYDRSSESQSELADQVSFSPSEPFLASLVSKATDRALPLSKTRLATAGVGKPEA